MESWLCNDTCFPCWWKTNPACFPAWWACSAGAASTLIRSTWLLTVSATTAPKVSRMPIIVQGDEPILEQIMKQLHKIVSVIKVMDFADIAAVEREMMFVKVQAEGPMRGEILRTVEIFRCKVVDVSTNEMTIEATGDHGKLEAIISLLQRFGIKELARTGSVAMRRSKKVD